MKPNNPHNFPNSVKLIEVIQNGLATVYFYKMLFL